MPTEKRQRQDEGRLNRRVEMSIAAKRQQRKKQYRNLGILLGVLVLGAFLWSLNGAGDDEDPVDTAASTSTTAAGEPEVFAYGSGECPAADGSSERTIDFEDAPQLCIDPAKSYSALIETTAGNVTVALDTELTPGAANNFVALARYHYYDETELFRTNTEIGIIQGGSPHTQDNSDPGPGYTIPDEGFPDEVAVASSGGPYSYVAGDLVYARPGGQPDSSSAQFFFCATDACSGLDSQGIYIEFGHVTEGLDVLQAILGGSPQGEGRPTTAVSITKVTITEQ
jgi:cyclophilin family peptidyl-prolyl cis-trans isomerase